MVLEKLREKGKFFLFNIPLEISLISMIRKKNILKNPTKMLVTYTFIQ